MNLSGNLLCKQNLSERWCVFFSISPFDVVVVTLLGDYCDECEDGYYGNAAAGPADEACRECPCYPPRVVNSTCDVNSDGNVTCLYCNDGYTGLLCDQSVFLLHCVLITRFK